MSLKYKCVERGGESQVRIQKADRALQQGHLKVATELPHAKNKTKKIQGRVSKRTIGAV